MEPVISKYPKRDATPLEGAEQFLRAGEPAGFSVLDFWRWSGSDLLGNAWRGFVAEFIVMKALGVKAPVWVAWDACDIRMPDGTRVEVKSTAYLQSWEQKELSAIQFSIEMKRGWDAATNTFAPEPCRGADVFVFCLLAHKEKATVDPLNLDQWEFYVLASSVLNEKCPAQKTIGLNSLIAMGARKVAYEDLAGEIGRVRQCA